MSGNHFISSMMDQLDFLCAKIKENKTKYYAREFYEQYKQFQVDGKYRAKMTENTFCRMLHKIDGVTKHKRHGRSMYSFNKSAMQIHLDVLCKEQLDGTREGLKRKRESDDELRPIEKQEAKCRKVMVEYAHSDSLTRLTIEPSLHRMLKSSFPDERKRSEFIKSLAVATGRSTMEYAGVYVLKLGGLPYTHYVGCSKTVLARIEQHKRGAGAACTAGAMSIEALPLLTEGSVSDLDAWERVETLTQMYTVGVNKVRGWHYVQRELSDEDKRGIHRNICSRNNLCYRCGFGSHMVTKCFARSQALWMGGGGLYGDYM